MCIFFECLLSYHGLNSLLNTFKRIFCEDHKVQKHSNCPQVHWNTIISVIYYFWRHILLSSAMSFCSYSPYWPREAKISNFIFYLEPISIRLLLKQNVFWLDISMNKVFLVNAFETLHHLYCDINRMLQWENSTLEAGLIGKKVSLFAIFHNDDNEVVSWI